MTPSMAESKSSSTVRETNIELVATDEEIRTLRNVPDRLPGRVWLACLIAAAERCSFYGSQALFQNCMQYGPNDEIPGILGLGQSAASSINYAFTGTVYLLPIFSGVIADGWLGRYRTIVWATGIYVIGLGILMGCTLPPALRAGAGPPGFVIALVLIAVGLGGCQSTIVPFIADQYEEHAFRVKVTKQGERLEAHGRRVPWDEDFHSQICTGFRAIKVCCTWPVLWLCIGHASSNGISQAGQLNTMGIPNDAIKSSNAIAVIILGIVVQKLLYPYLERRKIAFRPMARIWVGLWSMTLALAYGTGVQGMIYASGPCYKFPLECNTPNGARPTHINVLITLPMYVLIALAEIFAFVTGNEYAYKQAPKGMKSVVQSFYAIMATVGSVLGIALSPLSHNPYLVISWGVVTAIMFVTTCVFWIVFRRVTAGKEVVG
ncbi:peptide transporter ptr2 [Emydomyces testavorans]|uniref:Peptide transporter ptr2 n=1 Tax=Emydomyces testavorans TaxID=2070801 RepID=A0AAF0DM66_9EURO|nr:peptide transporter ptr2 [Emydomyces testavorans]